MATVKSNRPDRVWLVTGCSSGIGKALCEAVLAAGERVICTARRVEKVQHFAERYPDRALAQRLDVTDTASIEAAVEAGIARFGKIDVLVNNAGYGTIGAMEEISDSEIGRIIDTNVGGVVRVTRALLPHMRSRGSGHILNVGSALGFVTKGGYSVYSATKFAVEGISEGLAQEVAPFGIKVTILAPGSFRTDFRGDGLYSAPVMPAYAETLAAFRKDVVDSDGKQPGDPVRGAEAILTVVNSPEPPMRFAMGKQSAMGVRRKLNSVGAELDRWIDLSVSVDFPD